MNKLEYMIAIGINTDVSQCQQEQPEKKKENTTEVNKHFTLTTSKIHVNKPFKVLHTSHSVTEKPCLQQRVTETLENEIDQKQKFHKNANLSIFS